MGLDQKDKLIRKTVLETPGIRPSEISKTTGINLCTIRYRLQDLALRGFVKFEKSRQCVRVYPCRGG
ncbi:winged helix-turn-helix transcriptional regulator [Methanocella sp. MCL-LM]|uniref:winged helix-turn-helix transcriptional regulator n=1 Tax=Methanocella sp. MCL-LM TaxID=3412035 RepID=UPI003C73DE49